MSAIDSINHLRLGIFFGLPVYQPLASGSIGCRNPQDELRMPRQLDPHINIDKACILIGGGSAEQPAVAFHDIEHAVARYLMYANPERAKKLPEIEKKARAVQGDLQTIQYCDWSNQNHVNFRERCNFRFSFYASELSFEGWLLLNVGEFVFYVIPEFSKNISRWRQSFGPDLDLRFNGISIPYGRYGGSGFDRFQILDTLLSGPIKR